MLQSMDRRRRALAGSRSAASGALAGPVLAPVLRAESDETIAVPGNHIAKTVVRPGDVTSYAVAQNTKNAQLLNRGNDMLGTTWEISSSQPASQARMPESDRMASRRPGLSA